MYHIDTKTYDPFTDRSGNYRVKYPPPPDDEPNGPDPDERLLHTARIYPAKDAQGNHAPTPTPYLWHGVIPRKALTFFAGPRLQGCARKTLQPCNLDPNKCEARNSEL